MPLFKKVVDRAYVSDFTRFINDYLSEHPEIVAQQKANRATFWDRKVDFKALTEANEDKRQLHDAD